MQRVLQVFFKTDLRCGHNGLTKVARSEKLNVLSLKPGEYILFINNKQDKLKLYAANNVVAYWKALPGQVLNLHTIKEIPKVFEAKGAIEYDEILKTAVETQLKNRSNNKGAHHVSEQSNSLRTLRRKA